jgi:hypothetical protein
MKSALSSFMVLAIGTALAMAAEPPGGRSSELADQLNSHDQQITKVYRVSDLVLPAPDYAFNGVHLPGAGPFRRREASSGGGGYMGEMGGGGMGGGGMGGGGGGMGGMGGGMAVAGAKAPAKAPTSTSLRFDMDELIEAIILTIYPDTWDENGGPGSITVLGGMLIVRQHPIIHKELGLLLEELRRQGGTVTSVTIRAHWVVLDADQLRQLAPTIDSPDWQASRGGLNREAQKQIATAAGAVGQITCFSGQTVHIISGNYRNSTTGVTPIVGQLDRSKFAPAIAQQDARGDKSSTGDVRAVPQRSARHSLAQTVPVASADYHTIGGLASRLGAVGYETKSAFINFGALLQITPVLVPDADAVILDVQSSVLRRKQKENATVDFLGVLPLDRLNLVVQQFMTTLRVPLGQPVLVGGSTLEPISGDGSPQQQLYLVIEATKQ